MARNRKLLLVDDDDALLGMLGEQLELHEGFITVGTTTGAEALARAKTDHFDVIILDVGLPDMDGRDVCRLLRRGGVAAPILMLTGAGTDADTILGLDAGANDYVVKPFRLGVLLARIRALVRQYERSDDAVFKIGPYAFRPGGRVLIDRESEGREIRLTSKEAAILKYLYQARGGVVSHAKILDEVWGYNADVSTHTLETHIYRLRQKIERDPSDARLLITEPGGYRLSF